jgi:hypothetical protein
MACRHDSGNKVMRKEDSIRVLQSSADGCCTCLLLYCTQGTAFLLPAINWPHSNISTTLASARKHMTCATGQAPSLPHTTMLSVSQAPSSAPLRSPLVPQEETMHRRHLLLPAAATTSVCLTEVSRDPAPVGTQRRVHVKDRAVHVQQYRSQLECTAQLFGASVSQKRRRKRKDPTDAASSRAGHRGCLGTGHAAKPRPVPCSDT